MLEIGRALMSRPEIMLLDEPSMGLAPNLVSQVLEYVAQIAESGIGVLMVEQNIAALDIASYGYVLRQGAIVAEGPAVELSRSADVMSAYMGGTATPAAGATTP
jgi:branched-chain amino acid transport system ATP-binding protein